MSHTREFRTWQTMIQRCYNPKDISFKNYGARGIKVCKRWLYSFENFYADMGPKPIAKPHFISIERKDNKKGYYPKNCCWATAKQQANNRRNSRRTNRDNIDVRP